MAARRKPRMTKAEKEVIALNDLIAHMQKAHNNLIAEHQKVKRESDEWTELCAQGAKKADDLLTRLLKKEAELASLQHNLRVLSDNASKFLMQPLPGDRPQEISFERQYGRIEARLQSIVDGFDSVVVRPVTDMKPNWRMVHDGQ